MPATSPISAISPRGQTQVPQWVRNALHLAPGQQVRWNVRDGEASIRPVPKADPLAALGFAARHGLKTTMTTDEYLADLRGGETNDTP
jgi:bifunctional DNA-binding transcriptional regulator/antitoxin component of YhaV-PrlF toxin-antitoxin module